MSMLARTLVIAAMLAVSSAAYSDPLADKLSRQFRAYDAAREALIAKLEDDTLAPLEQEMTRAEWEAILSEDGALTWSIAEHDALRQDQLERIGAAATAARADPASRRISFDAVRSLPTGPREARAAEFCRRVPKGGLLHVHPSGTVMPGTARTLLETFDPESDGTAFADAIAEAGSGRLLYPAELAWFRALPKAKYSALPEADQQTLVDFFALPPGSHPFERFETIFNLLGIVNAFSDGIDIIWPALAERVSGEGVRYLELTTTVSDALLPKLEGVIEKIADDTGLIVRLNAAFVRTLPEGTNDLYTKELLAMPPSKYVQGIDLLANERSTPTLEVAQGIYGPVLAAVFNGTSTLQRTMHAGELGDPRNPRDAMILGAQRLGHGVKLWDDPVALEYAIRQNVAIESNISSNLKLQVAQTPRDNHFLKYLRLGLPVSLSTDDDGIFLNTIVDECERALLSTDLQYSEFRTLAENSLTSSFAPPELKAELLEALRGDMATFEAWWTMGLGVAPAAEVGASAN